MADPSSVGFSDLDLEALRIREAAASGFCDSA